MQKEKQMNLIEFFSEIEVDENNLRDTLSNLSDGILVKEGLNE